MKEKISMLDEKIKLWRLIEIDTLSSDQIGLG